MSSFVHLMEEEMALNHSYNIRLTPTRDNFSGLPVNIFLIRQILQVFGLLLSTAVVSHQIKRFIMKTEGIDLMKIYQVDWTIGKRIMKAFSNSIVRIQKSFIFCHFEYSYLKECSKVVCLFT